MFVCERVCGRWIRHARWVRRMSGANGALVDNNAAAASERASELHVMCVGGWVEWCLHIMLQMAAKHTKIIGYFAECVWM